MWELPWSWGGWRCWSEAIGRGWEPGWAWPTEEAGRAWSVDWSGSEVVQQTSPVSHRSVIPRSSTSLWQVVIHNVEQSGFWGNSNNIEAGNQSNTFKSIKHDLGSPLCCILLSTYFLSQILTARLMFAVSANIIRPGIMIVGVLCLYWPDLSQGVPGCRGGGGGSPGKTRSGKIMGYKVISLYYPPSLHQQLTVQLTTCTKATNIKGSLDLHNNQQLLVIQFSWQVSSICILNLRTVFNVWIVEMVQWSMRWVDFVVDRSIRLYFFL